MKHFLTWLKTGIGISGILTGIAMIIMGYSTCIPYKIPIYLSVSSILFPYISILAGFFILLTAFSKKWKMLIIQGILIISCISPLKHTFAWNFDKPYTKDSSFRVLSYNVMNFNYEHGKPEGFIRFVLQEDPDIICLQEFADRPEKDGYSLAQLTEKLKNYPYMDFQVHHETRYHSKIGICLFSKFPIEKIQPISYESRINSSCLYELNVHGKKLVIVNNHLESNGLSSMDLQIIKDYLTSFSRDLTPIFKDIMRDKIERAAKARMQQTTLIKKAIASAGEKYTLVCGDLNDTPLSPSLCSMREDLRDAFIGAGKGIGATHRFMKSGLRIDHLLHSESMIPYQFQVKKTPYSDHFPILCTFELK